MLVLQSLLVGSAGEEEQPLVSLFPGPVNQKTAWKLDVGFSSFHECPQLSITFPSLSVMF
jgi:hypothetical protein